MKKTLDEAICDALDIATDQRVPDTRRKECRQIAEWLMELKLRRKIANEAKPFNNQ